METEGKAHDLGWPAQSGQFMGIIEPTQPQTSGYPAEDMLSVSRLFAGVGDTLSCLEYGVEVLCEQRVLVS